MLNSAVWIEVGVAVVTFFSSVGASAFIAGVGWGKVQGDIRSLNEKVARIEGMFTLRLKDHE